MTFCCSGSVTGVMTDLLKTASKAKGENTSSEVKDPERERSSLIQGSSLWDPLAQATCLAGLSGTDGVPLELESKSSPPNCDIHSISIEPSVCQTHCLSLPRDLGGSVFLCHDHCVRLLQKHSMKNVCLMHYASVFLVEKTSIVGHKYNFGFCFATSNSQTNVKMHVGLFSKSI